MGGAFSDTVARSLFIGFGLAGISAGALGSMWIHRVSAPAEMDKTAPDLARLLRRDAIGDIAQEYERYDREAGEAQTVFKRTASLANWAVSLTAVLSAVMMVTGLLGGAFSDTVARSLFIGFGLAGISAGALGSMWIHRVSAGRLLEAWMEARAEAETRRLSYFSDLAQASANSKAKADIPLPLVVLEYFRRYQLDVQTAYYNIRRKNHKLSANKTSRLGAAAAGLASLAAGAAAFLGATLGPEWAAIAAVGVIASAMASFATTREAVTQDRRNAERYGRTLAILENLHRKLDRVRAGLAGGRQDLLSEYVAAVHEQLSLEHRQWLKKGQDTLSALAKLRVSCP